MKATVKKTWLVKSLSIHTSDRMILLLQASFRSDTGSSKKIWVFLSKSIGKAIRLWATGRAETYRESSAVFIGT